MQGLSILFAYYTVDVYKSFGLDVPAISDDKFLTTVGSVSALFNAARLFWSGSLDRIPFRFVYGFLLVLQICIAFTIHITSQDKTTYFIVICLELFCLGGHFALFPNVIRQIYGNQATSLYGLVFTGTGIASLIMEGFVLSPLGADYIVMFTLTGSGSVVAILILIFMFDDSRFKPDWKAIFVKSSTAKYY